MRSRGFRAGREGTRREETAVSRWTSQSRAHTVHARWLLTRLPQALCRLTGAECAESKTAWTPSQGLLSLEDVNRSVGHGSRVCSVGLGVNHLQHHGAAAPAEVGAATQPPAEPRRSQQRGGHRGSSALGKRVHSLLPSSARRKQPPPHRLPSMSWVPGCWHLSAGADTAGRQEGSARGPASLQ